MRILTVALLGAVGCGSEATGEVIAHISGEAGARRGYPSSAFADDWSVQFDRYLVSLGDFTLTSANGEEVRSATRMLVDLQKGEPELTRIDGLSPGRWDVGFRTMAPSDDTVTDAYVTAADVTRMRDGGFTYWLEGQAIRQPDGVYTFAMGFAADVTMSACTNGVDGTRGIIVPESSAADAEITIHVEHMFYDKLGTHQGVKLRFEAFAAAAGDDFVVTTDELATQNILDLRGTDGLPLDDQNGTPVIYNPGSYGVRTLLEFISQSIVDQAHLNGGGLCTVRRD